VGKRFRIEGHTDGQGSQAYNQALSERRAAAVRRELMAVHGVDPAQLDALGLGKSQLLDPSQPLAAANRRVRVINLGGTP
jgi:outer membrane protein OmpA-like peptidoglycan-associated protein